LIQQSFAEVAEHPSSLVLTAPLQVFEPVAARRAATGSKTWRGAVRAKTCERRRLFNGPGL